MYICDLMIGAPTVLGLRGMLPTNSFDCLYDALMLRCGGDCDCFIGRRAGSLSTKDGGGGAFYSFCCELPLDHSILFLLPTALS